MRLDSETRRALAMVSGLGFSIAFCLGASILVGLWLDDRFHSRPLFILLGIGFGLFGAGSIIYGLIRPRQRRPPSPSPPENGKPNVE
mgnify:CR=1 FL=1